MSGPTVADAVRALEAGELIGLPTDTVYGVAAALDNHEAVARLSEAKGRSTDKPLAVLVASIRQAESLALLNEVAVKLAREHWPGALTLVVPKRHEVPAWVGDHERLTVGIRMPDHMVALSIMALAGPIVATSANRAGERPARNAAEARSALGDEVAVYMYGAASGDTASTVVDVTASEARVLREGPIQIH